MDTGAVVVWRPGIIIFSKVVLPTPDGPIKIEQNILQAIQKAHELSTTTMKERMNDLTGGLNLNLPGFDNSES